MAVARPQYTRLSAPARLTSSTHAGYGFSSSPTQRGFGVSDIAKTFNELMLKLGYDTYVAQGRQMSCLPSSSPAHCMHCAPGLGHMRHPSLVQRPSNSLPCLVHILPSTDLGWGLSRRGLGGGHQQRAGRHLPTALPGHPHQPLLRAALVHQPLACGAAAERPPACCQLVPPHHQL